MAREIAFETFGAALEAVAGTAETTPDFTSIVPGTITPGQDVWRPEVQMGHLATNVQGFSRTTKEWAEITIDDAAFDIVTAPTMFASLVQGSVSPTSPDPAANLYSYTPDITGTSLESMTFWFGDDSVQTLRSSYAYVTEATFSATSEEGLTASYTAMGRSPESVTAPVYPAVTVPPLLIGREMQLWLDDTLSIGTTEITGGQVIAASVTVRNGVTFKYGAQGTTGTAGHTNIGRQKFSITMNITLEMEDETEYDYWKNQTHVLARLKFNGPVIATTFRNYLQFDVYGEFTELAWGEYVGSNRTLELTLTSSYNTTETNQYAVELQNAV